MRQEVEDRMRLMLSEPEKATVCDPVWPSYFTTDRK
jgi:hypothetical protein